MTTPRWRGTLIYTGTLATLGTVAVVRFGPLAASDEGVPVAAADSAVLSSSGTAAPSAGATDDTTTSDSSTQSGTTTDPTSPSASGTTAPAEGSTTSSTVTVAGAVSQTRYGPVQVSVTFTGTQIVDVQTLQAPSDHHESAQISERSTPILAQEVLAAQSAAIDTVSGATYTSEAYAESVQSAIDQVG